MSLESKIDDLYRLPLDQFTAARNALARMLSGADAKRVKKLVKPAAVAAAVNQVYWSSRRIYDRLIESGERLRKAQIAALEGRPADVRAAAEAHRGALAGAVREAERYAEAGSRPASDALMRTFEALSLAPGAAVGEPHGRLTAPLQPAGFEALAGVATQPIQQRQPQAGLEKSLPAKALTPAAEARIERAAAAEARRREAALKKADADLVNARKAEADARQSWELATHALDAAQLAAERVRSGQR